MNFKILMYTHSDYSFLWKATIPLLEKYAKFDIVWCCDKLLDYKIPDSWTLYNYDDSLTWSSRVKGCIEKTMENTDYILYLQEDWLPIDKMDEERIQYCMNIMADNSIDYLTSQNYIPCHNEIYDTPYGDYKFKVILGYWLHPAIWKKSVLKELVSFDKPLSKAEKEEPEALMLSKFCVTIFNSKFINHPSIRCFFYPHIHAINSGEWTFVRYPCLKAIVEAYGIDTSLRKINTWWHTHEE